MVVGHQFITLTVDICAHDGIVHRSIVRCYAFPCSFVSNPRKHTDNSFRITLLVVGVKESEARIGS